MTTTNYVYDVGGGLPVLLDHGSHKYVWGLGLAYTTVESGNLQGVYHTDGLGSVHALTDSSGSVVQTYGTDEFGIADAMLTTGTNSQSMQYTGEQRDSESSLMSRSKVLTSSHRSYPLSFTTRNGPAAKLTWLYAKESGYCQSVPVRLRHPIY